MRGLFRPSHSCEEYPPDWANLARASKLIMGLIILLIPSAGRAQSERDSIFASAETSSGSDRSPRYLPVIDNVGFNPYSRLFAVGNGMAPVEPLPSNPPTNFDRVYADTECGCSYSDQEN